MGNPDLIRERFRRMEPLSVPYIADSPGRAAFVGKVVTSAAVGQFITVNPVVVLGTETVSGSGSFSVDTSTLIATYLTGTTVPNVGDNLICKFTDYRWVAENLGSSSPPNACAVTWPKVLTCDFSVAQANSPQFFFNFPAACYPVMCPESPYLLTYQARPAAIPASLTVSYLGATPPGFVGIGPPFKVACPLVGDHAWFSDPIPVIEAGTSANVYFWLWFKGCSAFVMVIDDLGGGTVLGAAGGGLTFTSNVQAIQRYQQIQAGDSTHPYEAGNLIVPDGHGGFTSVVVVSGTHGSDDITPDAQGGAGYPGPVTGKTTTDPTIFIFFTGFIYRVSDGVTGFTLFHAGTTLFATRVGYEGNDFVSAGFHGATSYTSSDSTILQIDAGSSNDNVMAFRAIGAGTATMTATTVSSIGVTLTTSMTITVLP